MSVEQQTRQQHQIDWQGLIEHALEAPGSLGNSYSRFHRYSYLNMMYLLSQDCPIEPVATYQRWGDVGRHVKKGSKAKEIIRPITVKLRDELDDEGNPRTITKFKSVRSIFSLSDTAGDDLPEYEPPHWSAERALGALAISRVPFELMDGNTAGYSFERNVAINPVAPYPLKTMAHEIAHIESGHTAKEKLAEYAIHRGLMEFEAEGSAYLTMSELAVPEGTWNPSESRAYVQHWLQGDRPPDTSIRTVFKVTDSILKSGREEAA